MKKLAILALITSTCIAMEPEPKIDSAKLKNLPEYTKPRLSADEIEFLLEASINSIVKTIQIAGKVEGVHYNPHKPEFIVEMSSKSPTLPNALIVYNATTNQPTRTIEQPAPPERIQEFKISKIKCNYDHSGTLLATAYNGLGTFFFGKLSCTNLVIWDLQTGNQILQVLHPERVSALTFNHDSTQVLIAEDGTDDIIEVYDITNPTPTSKSIFRKAYNITSNPHKKQFASHLENDIVTLWDAQSCETITELTMPESITGNKKVLGYKPNSIGTSIFSPDRTMLITGLLDGSIHVWNLENYQRMSTLQSTESKPDLLSTKISLLKCDQKTNQLVSYSIKSGLKFWNLNNGKCVLTLNYFRLFEGRFLDCDLQSNQFVSIKSKDQSTIIKIADLSFAQKIINDEHSYKEACLLKELIDKNKKLFEACKCCRNPGRFNKKELLQNIPEHHAKKLAELGFIINEQR